jgi:hypothetical protein
MRYVAVALLAVALAGCSTAQRGLEIGQEVYEITKERKEAEKAEKQAAADAAEAQRVAAEKAEAARVAAEKAEYERKRDPGPHPAEYRQAAIDAGASYLNAKTQPLVRSLKRGSRSGTYWKAANHSLNGVVMLLNKTEFAAAYAAKEVASVVVAADPAGTHVIDGSLNGRKVSGIAKLTPPYSDGRPAIRWDGIMGHGWRPGPVFIVLKYTDGRRVVWHIPDPGIVWGE